MKRLAIRNYMRFLINELSELPEGTFKDDDSSIFDINEIINLAQENVYLRLIQLVPEEFRKPFLISLVAAKGEYNIETDLGITDFWRMEDIYHNVSAKPKHGLLYVDPDQISDIGINVGDTGADPKCWYWESKGVLGILPIPSSSIANRLKAYYFYEIPNLTHDSDDDIATSVVGTTIAFVNSTSKITDSNNGLAGFVTGDKIRVSGSVSNDGDYSVAVGGVAGEIVVNETLVDEGAGASVTITMNNVATPKLPKVVHKLIAIDGVKQLQIANEEGALEVMEIFKEEEKNVLKLLGMKPSFSSGVRSSIRNTTR